MFKADLAAQGPRLASSSGHECCYFFASHVVETCSTDLTLKTFAVGEPVIFTVWLAECFSEIRHSCDGPLHAAHIPRGP